MGLIVPAYVRWLSKSVIFWKKKKLAAQKRARGPGVERGHDAVRGACVRVAAARLLEVRAHVAAVGGRGGDGAAARLRARGARGGARGPGAKGGNHAVRGARVDVAAARLLEIRAHVAAVRGRGGDGTAARLRARATRQRSRAYIRGGGLVG